MQRVENVSLSGVLVAIDDKFFLNCRFEQCTLIYTGSDFGWANTQFIGCTLQFDGAAKRTLEFLKYFNMVPQQQPAQPAQPPSDTKVN